MATPPTTPEKMKDKRKASGDREVVSIESLASRLDDLAKFMTVHITEQKQNIKDLADCIGNLAKKVQENAGRVEDIFSALSKEQSCITGEIEKLKSRIEKSGSAIPVGPIVEGNASSGIEDSIATLHAGIQALKKDQTTMKSSASALATRQEPYVPVTTNRSFAHIVASIQRYSYSDQTAVVNALASLKRGPPRQPFRLDADASDSDALNSVEFVHFANIVSCPYAKLRENLRTMHVNLSQISSMNWIRNAKSQDSGRAILELVCAKGYSAVLKGLMRGLGFSHIEGFKPAEASNPAATQAIKDRIKTAFVKRCCAMVQSPTASYDTQKIFRAMLVSSGAMTTDEANGLRLGMPVSQVRNEPMQTES